MEGLRVLDGKSEPGTRYWVHATGGTSSECTTRARKIPIQTKKKTNRYHSSIFRGSEPSSYCPSFFQHPNCSDKNEHLPEDTFEGARLFATIPVALLFLLIIRAINRRSAFLSRCSSSAAIAVAADFKPLTSFRRTPMHSSI